MLYWFGILGIIDHLLSLINYLHIRQPYTIPRTSLQWFQLHCISNLLITIQCWREFTNILSNQDHILIETTNHEALYLAISLHIYHILFWRISEIDRIHHISSVFICGPLMLYINTQLVSWLLIIATGIPGGIDYFLLVLVKLNKLTMKDEKNANALLNTYFRGPFGVLGSYFCYRYIVHTEYKSQQAAAAIIMITSYWNANYFTKLAVENNIKYKIQ